MLPCIVGYGADLFGGVCRSTRAGLSRGSGSPGAGHRPSVPVWCVAFDYIYYYIDISVNVKHYFTEIQEKL